MAVDGIGSIFSAPKNAFKAGEALIGGIKVVGASEAVIDMTKISGIALEGVGSAASSIAGALEAGAGIYNMSGGSSGGIGFDDLDLDNASNKQKGNYGEHKADDNLINNQSLKDAGYDLKSLGREAPCKTAFEDSSNVSEITLDLASFAMGVYGVKQFVSSGANYLRMNKSYINANISEAAQNSKILKQAISNIKQNPKGITLPSDIGVINKYVSDVKGEFDALKNCTKVAGNAKAGGNASIDELVTVCEEILI